MISRATMLGYDVLRSRHKRQDSSNCIHPSTLLVTAICRWLGAGSAPGAFDSSLDLNGPCRKKTCSRGPGYAQTLMEHLELEDTISWSNHVMITELIRYNIQPAQAGAFEEAYRQTEKIMKESEHCLGYELLRGIEEPDNWVLLIYWDSVEGHEQGFRTEAGFAEFFKLVKPFFQQIQEMKHYESRNMRWKKTVN